jgi:hypothetical protein
MTEKNEKTKIGFIEGVACYVKVHKPYTKYQSEDKEFTLDLVISKDQAKQWKKDFKKQPPKEFDNDDFKNTFKIDPPFEDQDEQFVVKLKVEAQYKDGAVKEKKFWPRVLVMEDGAAVDIAEGILVGNGSKVKVSYNVRSNDYGTFAKLKNILVLDLIEFEDGGGAAGSEFGLQVKGNSEFEDNVEDNPKEVKNSSSKAPAKASKKEEQEDDLDSDCPF